MIVSVKDRINSALWWLMNWLFGSFSLSIRVVYFQRKDRTVSKSYDRMNWWIAYSQSKDRILPRKWPYTFCIIYFFKISRFKIRQDDLYIFGLKTFNGSWNWKISNLQSQNKRNSSVNENLGTKNFGPTVFHGESAATL